MSEVVSAKDLKSESKVGTSAIEEAEEVVAQASVGRTVSRLLMPFVVVGGLGLAGYYGYRAYLAHQARSAPMKSFPAGKATIGNALWPDESPVHEISLAAYELDVYEVTVKDYRTCLDQGVCKEHAKVPTCNLMQKGRDDHPINCVSHAQAEAYCKWVGKRLPTEKEWEHAARMAFDEAEGKRSDLFPWGKHLPDETLTNGCGLECAEHFAKKGLGYNHLHEANDGFPTTAPVGRFPDGKTPMGLHDMAGNVWEWTSSPFCQYPDEECGNTLEYMIRGGGFQSFQARTFEATSREALGHKEMTETVGFRCARSVSDANGG